MFDFIEKKYDISDCLYWMPFPELGRKACVLVAHAGQANPNYYNAMLAMSGQRVRQMAKSNTITAEDAALSRDEDRELFPMFIIRDWRMFEGDPDGTKDGVELDDDGFVKFSRKAARGLCAVLPPHLMDYMRNEAATPERFYPDDKVAPPDVDGLVEN